MIDVNVLRALITLISFICFLGIVWWAYSSRRSSAFSEAANLPFADETMQQRTVQKNDTQSGLADHPADKKEGN